MSLPTRTSIRIRMMKRSGIKLFRVCQCGHVPEFKRMSEESKKPLDLTPLLDAYNKDQAERAQIKFMFGDVLKKGD